MADEEEALTEEENTLIELVTEDSELDSANNAGAAFLRMRGLEIYSENSKEAAYLRKKADDYISIAESSKLPDKMVEKLVKMACETEILRDYCVTWLAKHPYPRMTAAEGIDMTKEKRAVYSVMVSSYKSYAALGITLLKLLAGTDKVPSEGQGATVGSMLKNVADMEIKQNEKDTVGG